MSRKVSEKEKVEIRKNLINSYMVVIRFFKFNFKFIISDPKNIEM